MPDHMINIIDPRSGEQKLLKLRLSEFEFMRAKRSLLRSSSDIRNQIPEGFAPCDESFVTP